MEATAIAKLQLKHVSSFPVECPIFTGGLTAIVGRNGSSGLATLLALASKKPPAIVGRSVRTELVGQNGVGSKRATIQNLVSNQIKSQPLISGEAITEVLVALGLWDVRKSPLHSISASFEPELTILRALFSKADVVLYQYEFDRIDPYTLRQLFEVFHAYQCWGKALVALTHSAEVASKANLIIGFAGTNCTFLGSPQDLITQSKGDEFEVESTNWPAVLEMVKRFEIEVDSVGDHLLRFRAKPGQELTAKLLAEGYGDIRFLTKRRPTFEEALTNLLSRRPIGKVNANDGLNPETESEP